MPTSDPPPLPPPSALFGSSLFDYHRQRPLYILPPPPGYHHPPPPPPPPSSSSLHQPPYGSGVKRELSDPDHFIKKRRTADDGQQEINAARTLASFATAKLTEECCGCQGDPSCDRCGHPRHTESWKAGMSKRQQVQIMEAAQILMDIARCGMRVSVA
ncbi:hypothetical protein BJV82DRAFT_607791 [Fennellomyces sp. T-0311]|nr:hypothetical protein BJV82DRAFT_607791 [Fennellomyces sp. T-0311]